MKILGIDYGRKKVGIAISEGSLADPFVVIRYKDVGSLIKEIGKIVEREKIEKLVIGISEGEMGEESKAFSNQLAESLSVSIETFDETLTSQDAQRLSREAGVARKKRHEMEDAYAASLMLQNFLDEKAM